MGCRNPWRINVDQRTGYLYWGDVGPDAGSKSERGPRGYDEINQARKAGFFGWPYFIGKNFAYSMVDFATGEIHPPQNPAHPINESVNNTGARELPPAQPAMVYYPGGASEEFPAVGTGGRTACAGPVYYFEDYPASETKFPAVYNATLFAFDWSRNGFWAVHLDDQSNFDRIEPFLPNQQFVRPIDMQFDAAGSLVVMEYGETWGVNPDAKLVRIDYVRGNRAPVAMAEASNTMGREPLEVQLSAAKSVDKDSDPLIYQWSIVRNTDPTAEAHPLSEGESATARFEEPGVYTVRLAVTDPSGASSETTLPVIVGNSRPEVEFLSPKDGDFFDAGKPIAYQAAVRDREDGTSDIDQAEEDDWHFIESGAPSRLFVEAVPAAAGGAKSQSQDPPGLALIRKSDCFNCHAIDRRLVGPSFLDIANKYRDQPHQLDQSVTRVMQGSTGVWGKIGMLPHQQHTRSEVLQMVTFVFSQTAGSANPTVVGFRNQIPTTEASDSLRLEATYTDLGRDDIPPLSGRAEVRLRSRHVQAESADAYGGTQPLSSDAAENKTFMGAIEHNGFLKFADVRLDQIKSITARVASAGAGGSIEIHQGSVDGPLLGSAEVEINGAWEVFYDKQIELTAAHGRDDLFIVFKHPLHRNGLMNIDSLNFN